MAIRGRIRPSMRLSTLLLLVAFVALSMGWLVDRRRMNQRLAQSEIQNEIYERQVTDLQERLSEKWASGGAPVFYWANADEFIRALLASNGSIEAVQAAASLPRTNPSSIQEVVEKLVPLLDDPEHDTRMKALEALRVIAEFSGNADVACAEAITACAEAVVPKLAVLVDDSSDDIAITAIDTLRYFGAAGKPALEKLKRRMMDDEDWWAPEAAVTVAAIDPSVDVGARLIEMIESKHPNWVKATFLLPRFVSRERARQVLSEFYANAENDAERHAVIQSLLFLKP